MLVLRVDRGALDALHARQRFGEFGISGPHIPSVVVLTPEPITLPEPMSWPID